jgi:hypothetical protein
MPYIGPLTSNITFVITRTGDLEPYTTAIGALMNDTWSDSDADTFATALKTATLPNLSTGEQLVSIDFAYNAGTGISGHSTAFNLSGTGSPISALVPQNTAFLIQKRTGVPGRHGRGRMFWPSVWDTDVDAVGAVAPGTKTRIQTMLTAWQNAIVSATTFDSFALLHSISTPDASKITSLSCGGTVATQRRRLRR